MAKKGAVVLEIKELISYVLLAISLVGCEAFHNQVAELMRKSYMQRVHKLLNSYPNLKHVT